MIISHVVACSENGVIGKDGSLPWHIPEELKRFRSITMGKILIMGRKTFESIGKVLPGRYTIIVSRSEAELCPGVKQVTSIEEAISHATEISSLWNNESCIVGGGEIYRQTINLIDKLYLTKVQCTVEGEVSYPIEVIKDFNRISIEIFLNASTPFVSSIFMRKDNNF